LTESGRWPKVGCCNRAWGAQRLKKSALIVVAIIVAPLLVVNMVLAAADWRTIGQTDAGDKVSVSSVRVLKNNQRVALVRIEYKEPADLPQGGPFVEMRARVRFDCSNGGVAPTTEWFYSRDRSGRFVVSKKATHDDQFGKGPEGGFADLISKSVCSQNK
jgi:hypothetical protein